MSKLSQKILSAVLLWGIALAPMAAQAFSVSGGASSVGTSNGVSLGSGSQSYFWRTTGNVIKMTPNTIKPLNKISLGNRAASNGVSLGGAGSLNGNKIPMNPRTSGSNGVSLSGNTLNDNRISMGGSTGSDGNGVGMGGSSSASGNRISMGGSTGSDSNGVGMGGTSTNNDNRINMGGSNTSDNRVNMGSGTSGDNRVNMGSSTSGDNRVNMGSSSASDNRVTMNSNDSSDNRVTVSKVAYSLCNNRPYPKDIDGHWAEIYIRRLYDLCIIEGYRDGTFRPEQHVTRAELVKMALYSKGIKPNPGCYDNDCGSPFMDLDTWQGPWIRPAWDRGIIQGYAYDEFRPNQSITRAEAVKVILATYGYEPLNVSQSFFNDVSGWSVGWVEKAHEIGMVQGIGNGNFDPNRPITRAESAKIIAKMMEYWDTHIK
jgi:hypothetical protein